ncbi:MAG: 30S ribosomal protein S1 [Oscillospiraceae bacterium]|nr:30S ribosomal protein S1 [Oscillospiraceae bacterium]
MMDCYLPEGRPSTTRRPADDALAILLDAYSSGQILEGQAISCSADHDLTVQFGNITGVIPRVETALGIEEGATKEIAILSRVGKPVCFTVIAIQEKNGMLSPVFSRRAAQRAALQHLYTLPEGAVLSATVTHLEPFGAFLDVGCGVVTMLGIENISISRIAHPAQRFTPGQQVYVILTGKEPSRGRVTVSHKELLGTWLENADLFSRGMTVSGYVRGVKSYGIFVELTPNLSGLAEMQEGVLPGDRVSVFLKAILPEKRKIKLLIIDKLPPAEAVPPLRYFITEGQVSGWQYAPAVNPHP